MILKFRVLGLGGCSPTGLICDERPHRGSRAALRNARAPDQQSLRTDRGGDLALLASVNGALAAIDAAGLPVDAEPVARAIVSEAPGLPITLALYAEDGRAVAVELPAVRAVMLAARLIEAALPRLERSRD